MAQVFYSHNGTYDNNAGSRDLMSSGLNRERHVSPVRHLFASFAMNRCAEEPFSTILQCVPVDGYGHRQSVPFSKQWSIHGLCIMGSKARQKKMTASIVDDDEIIAGQLFNQPGILRPSRP